MSDTTQVVVVSKVASDGVNPVVIGLVGLVGVAVAARRPASFRVV